MSLKKNHAIGIVAVVIMLALWATTSPTRAQLVPTSPLPTPVVTATQIPPTATMIAPTPTPIPIDVGLISDIHPEGVYYESEQCLGASYQFGTLTSGSSFTWLDGYTSVYFMPNESIHEYVEAIRFHMPNAPSGMSAYKTTLLLALGMKNLSPTSPESQDWLIQDAHRNVKLEGTVTQGTVYEEQAVQVHHSDAPYIDLYLKPKGSGNMTIANVRSQVCFSVAVATPTPTPPSINMDGLSNKVSLPVILK